MATLRSGLHPAPLHKLHSDKEGVVDPLWRGWYDTLRQQFNSTLVITTGTAAVSPFIYVNQAPAANKGQTVAVVHFFITAGTASAAISRDGGVTFFSLPTQTMYTLSGGDELKLTFAGVINYTVVPQ